MTAPTPGPWKVGGIHSHKRSCGPNCKQSIHGADGSTVAVVFRAASRTLNSTGTEYVDVPTDSPDAALVAAAPDLLAALIAIVKVIDRAPDRECPAGALEMARAAIKKAEGRSNG